MGACNVRITAFAWRGLVELRRERDMLPCRSSLALVLRPHYSQPTDDGVDVKVLNAAMRLWSHVIHTEGLKYSALPFGSPKRPKSVA